MRISTVAVIATASAQLAYATTVEFFYTDTLDTCKYQKHSIQANGQTVHGGICAFRPDVDRVYGCPAPDPTCWTWAQDCNTNGIGQVICNRDNTQFCCNAVAGETCTTTAGQINVCVSNFTSPNSGVSINDANAAYLKALGVSNVTATSQSIDPTPFSTRTLSGTAALSTSSSLSATSSSDLTTTNLSSATDTATAAKHSNSSAQASVSGSSSISGGAIAGIVIGVVVGIAIVGAAFFLLGKRRKYRSGSDVSLAKHQVPLASAAEVPAYSDNEQKNYGDYYAPVEIGNESVRAEMPTTSLRPPANQSRYEMP